MLALKNLVKYSLASSCPKCIGNISQALYFSAFANFSKVFLHTPHLILQDDSQHPPIWVVYIIYRAFCKSRFGHFSLFRGILLQVLRIVVGYALAHLKQTASEIPEKCLQMDFCK